VAEPYDIIVAGGGLIGAALALGLRDSGFKIALLEAQPHAAVVGDARTIALSHGSRLILERLGVWQSLTAITPIEHISISQQRGFGRVELHAAEARVPALGYVAGYTALQHALTLAVGKSGVRVMAGCAAVAVNGDDDSAAVTVDCGGAQQELSARLVAIADGGANLRSARIKTRDYHQSAVVCDVVSEQSHQNRAHERFTPGGPLALLPTERGRALIWTAAPERAQELASLPDAEFCAQLRASFGAALGAFRLLGPRQVYPLVLKYATRPVAPRSVLVGNAAQTLHPVAGQGFNLGLRDAWELARALMARDVGDPGALALLEAFSLQRRPDRTATILFTDSLIRLFSKDIPLFNHARAVGLVALASLPPAKNFLARRMMFGARG
jgi:2-octaprenyl-6-methoxyphenol hydroxylase